MENQKSKTDLFRRYLDDLYTTDDARQLFDDLQNTEKYELPEALAAGIWEESAAGHLPTGPDREQYKREARRLLKRLAPATRVRLRRLAAAAVAVVAAVICSTFFTTRYLNQRSERQPALLEITTSHSERKRLLLPDGTELTLNACSRVRYPEQFEGKERKVELEGEGYFHVRRNEKQPFFVVTPRMNIRVLGTCFNVKTYTSDEVVSVEVENGRVQVDLPGATMRLQAQEAVRINTASGEYGKYREERPVAVWKKGALRFSSTPVRDVAKELERIYNCRIIFAEGQPFDNLISGEHDNKNLEAVLQSIGYTSDIRYKKEGNRILLYKK